MTVVDVDRPETLVLHADTIQRKKFLKRVYLGFYQEFLHWLPSGGVFVELGSGGGFIKEPLPNVITSDLVSGPEIDAVFSAEEMPFPNDSVDSFLLLNVFHHLKDPARALGEMARCLRPGGRVIMIEPFNSWWARFAYRHFHFESFDPKADWHVKGDRRISDANDALAWIVFVRDRALFEKEFPQLRVELVQGHTPFSYIISGGVTREIQFLPAFLYRLVYWIERLLSPLAPVLALFVSVRLSKS